MTETRARIETIEDALAAVAQVGPVAREHAQKCEDGRRLAPEVLDAIADTGLWRVFGPRAIGDAGLGGLAEQFEILRAFAYEDMSAAWALFICGTSNGFVGARLSDAGRAEVFAAGGIPIAGVFNPGGSGAPAADGGLGVSGRWPFASGITYAQWVVANVIALDDAGVPRPGIGGLPEIQTVVVRQEDVSLIDDWHVAGLRGTGSMTFTMESVTVPQSRCFPFFGRATIDDPKYQLPIISGVAPGFASLAVGLAQRALDEVTLVLPTRVGSTSVTSSSARCASPTARLAKPGATPLMIGSWYFGSSIVARPKNGKHLDCGTVTLSIVNVIEPVPRRPATCQSSMRLTSSCLTTTVWISGSPPIPGLGTPASSSAMTLATTHCA